MLLQAGNLHSGACDPFEECVPIAHEYGAWVHVDGAFGLWAAASPSYRHLTAGVELADSWATDAHKTLNVPYDCGIVAVRDAAALNAAVGAHGDYFITDAAGDPMDRVPEMSRRARAVPVWAALRASGRSGVAEMVDRLCRHARTFADAMAEIPGAEVLNDVVFTQVCVSFGSDERTQRGGRPDAGRRRRLDERLAVARPGGAADRGEQRDDDRRRRGAQHRGTPERGARGDRARVAFASRRNKRVDCSRLCCG